MINVRLHYYTDRVAVEIEDDGVGFDPEHLPKEEEKTEEHSGFGLSMMKERVYLLSGTIQIDSIPHQGTKVSVEVPISN
jgi:two-component system sensor histidine kinase DegS